MTALALVQPDLPFTDVFYRHSTTAPTADEVAVLVDVLHEPVMYLPPVGDLPAVVTVPEHITRQQVERWKATVLDLLSRGLLLVDPDPHPHRMWAVYLSNQARWHATRTEGGDR